MYTVPVFVPEYKNTSQRDATDGVFSLTTTTVKTVTASSAINSLLAKYGGSSFRLKTKQDLWHYAQQASGAVIFDFGAVFTAPMIGGNEWEYVLKREVNPYPGRIVKATFYVIPDADGSIVPPVNAQSARFSTHCKRWFSIRWLAKQSFATYNRRSWRSAESLGCNQTSFGNALAVTKT